MSETWGRPDSAGTWPRPKPVSTLATLVLAVVAGLAMAMYQYAVTWTPLARWYLPLYLRSAVMAGLGVTATGHYRLLQVVSGTGSRLALEDEVRPVATETGQETFALTETAVHLGDQQLAWQDRAYHHQQLHAFLGRWIYRDQTLTDLLMPAVWGGVGVFLAGLLIAIPRDLARSRERRHGRRLRGPELLMPAQFNRRSLADGIGVRQQRPAWGHTPVVRLPRAIESSHLLLMGDSGTGKSGLIRQLLQQVDARGDTAIVYDPAREFTPEFYTPERGDVLLNPLDERSPYWNPADEVRQDAEALTVAASLFPDRRQDKEFFTEGPRRLFAHLLRIGLSLEELTWILCHEDELDRRVRGTSYAPMIAPQAPQQRSGIIASFNMVADALQLLPRERDTTSRWSTTAWSRDRQGWVFLPSTPETREPLIPLVSWWLDLLVLRLMQQGRHPRPTWFVLDELASLQRLPQLHTAITENRKSGNPVVLGFQGRSQLETRYGGDATTILSQPATKIFFRTSEAEGAKWIAETIGNIEIERLRESRSHGRGDQQSYGLERQTEPLVMDSEITGLPNLHGYLKLGNLVVRLHLPFVDGITRAPALIERIPPRRTDRRSPRLGAAHPRPTVPRRPPPTRARHAVSGPARRTAASLARRSATMLTFSRPLSAAQVVTYHAEEFSNARENYYTQGDTIASQWHGQLATRWGLSGDVTQAHVAHLAHGRHPMTGDQLIESQTPRSYVNTRGKTVTPMAHRAAWDGTFSAPKSVSITALLGDGDARVRAAHRASVRVALDAMEPYVQARIGRNHPAETTGQWIAATYEHESARPVDGYAAPQLHTHVVAFNLTERANGTTRALQTRELFKTQSYATAVYRAELATRLIALGYEIERGANDQPEIRGYTPAYLEASSPRRQQIEAHLQHAGQHGAGAAQIAAHRTRAAKRDIAHEETARRHHALAETHGHQRDAVIQVARDRVARLERHVPRTTAREAVTYARDHHFEREAVVDERALRQDAHRRGMGEVTVGAVGAEFERCVAAGEFVTRTQPPGAPGRAFTTRELIELEGQSIQMMRAGRETQPALVHDQTRRDLERTQAHLSDAQRAAVAHIFASRDQVLALEGVAGSGKTTALAAVRAGAEREGYHVEGFAPTSRAAQKLAEAGIDTTTLQHFLLRRPARAEAPDAARHLYVLDESSLASTRQMHAFLQRLTPADRVLLVGDVRQHQAVEAGRPYQQLQEAGLDIARLDDIIRQRDPALKAVVERLAHGEVRDAIHDLEQQGRVHEIPKRDARLTAIAHAYAEDPDGTLVVSPDNRSRVEINQRIHTRMQTIGRVDAAEHHVRVLVPRQEITGADRQWAQRYEPGDVLRYSTGSRVLDIPAGTYARVHAVEAPANLLTVHTTAGEVVTYDPRRLQGVAVYRETDRAFAKGDRLQITAPDRERHIANRELGTLESIDASGELGLRLDSGRRVTFSLDDHPHLDYGYAVTSHSSQGQTADRVIVHVDTAAAGKQLVNRRFAYVAVSRGRYDAQIYTNDRAQLGNALSRETSHRSAMEFGQVQEPSTPKLEPSAARRQEIQLNIGR